MDSVIYMVVKIVEIVFVLMDHGEVIVNFSIASEFTQIIDWFVQITDLAPKGIIVNVRKIMLEMNVNYGIVMD